MDEDEKWRKKEVNRGKLSGGRERERNAVERERGVVLSLIHI